MDLPQQRSFTGPLGSLDEDGAGDHDQPYRFGWRPRASVPYPFNTRQYARLLILRSRVQDECEKTRRLMSPVAPVGPPDARA
jgi:hypothetical protein